MSFDGGQVVSDAGLLPNAQLDRKLGILAEAARRLPDPRWYLWVTHTPEQILRQQMFQMLAGRVDFPRAQQINRLINSRRNAQSCMQHRHSFP